MTLVASIIGFVAVLILNAFVLDEYDAYGEVPIPGSSSLHLPEVSDRQLPHRGHRSAHKRFSHPAAGVAD